MDQVDPAEGSSSSGMRERCRTIANDDDRAQHQHDERRAPDQQRLGFERRIEAHEFAVAVGHESKNGVIALAGDQHLAHLPAQIRRELDIRIGDRFVLTDQASQILGDALEAALQRRIPSCP